MTLPARSATHPVQVAVWERLSADPELSGMVSGVFSLVPEGTAYPYVRILLVTSNPDNDHSGFGREINVETHVWDKSPSNVVLQQIAGRVGELLDHREAELSPAGHRVVSVRNEFEQELPDPDPQIRRHVIRFRIVVSQLPE